MGSSELRYGFLTGIICIVWAAIPLLFRWTGTGIGDIFDYIGIIIIAVGAYYAVRERKAEQGVAFTFGKAFFTAITTCFVIALLMGAFYYVYAKFVDPNQVERMVKKGMDIMTARKSTPQEMQRVEANIRTMYSPNGQFMSNSGVNMLYGLFVSLIIAAFTSRKREAAAK
jgi:hypothetical protein